MNIVHVQYMIRINASKLINRWTEVPKNVEFTLYFDIIAQWN